jgi:Immunity protein Imm1
MFIRFLSVDKRVGRTNQGARLADPGWDAIENAIRQLDGKSRTSVMIGRDDDTTMSIGGGPSLFTSVILIENSRGPYYLIDPNAPNAEVMLVVGGQKIGLPKNLTVDLATTLHAAKTFSETGELDATAHWQDGV